MPILSLVVLWVLQASSKVLYCTRWSLPWTRSTRNSRNRPSCSTNCESRILIPPHSKNHASDWAKSRGSLPRSNQEVKMPRKRSVCYSKLPRYAISSFIAPLLLKKYRHFPPAQGTRDYGPGEMFCRDYVGLRSVTITRSHLRDTLPWAVRPIRSPSFGKLGRFIEETILSCRRAG